MAPRRTPAAALAVLITVAAACSGEAAPAPTTPVTDPAEPTTNVAETGAPDTTTSTSTNSSTTSTTVAVDRSLPTLDDLADLEAGGEIDTVQLAVSEFAAIFDVAVDGAIPARIDPALSIDPSALIELLDALGSELTDGQRQQIDDALASIQADAVVFTNADIGDPGSVGAAPSTDTTVPVTVEFETEWNGLRAPAQAIDPRLLEELRGAQTFVMGSLGGTLPQFTASFVTPESRTSRQQNYLGWARTRTVDGERTCDITIVNFPPGTDDARSQKGTVIHEFFHCWHGANFDGSVEDYWWSPRWVKEGLAKWVEAEAVDTSGASTWAAQFLWPTSVNLYNRTYAAVGFFWQVGYWAGGPQGVWDRIPEITKQPNSPSAYEASIAGLDEEKSSAFASSSAQLTAVGVPWVFEGPFGPPGARDIRTVRVETVAGDSANAGGQALTQFEFVAPSDAPMIITTTHVGPNVILWRGDPEARSALFSNDETIQWCLNGPCVCEDGNPPFEPTLQVPGNDPRMLVGLTGTADDGARIKMAIIDLEDACTPPTDSGLVGEWIADVDAVREAFNEAYSLIGVNVTGVSGEVRMTLRADGVFILSYDNVQLNLNDEFVGEIVVNGFGELQWSGIDGAVTTMGVAKFNLSIETPSLGGPPIEINSETLGFPVGTLTFDAATVGNALTVSNVDGSLAVVPPGQPNIIVFPTEWIRAR